MGIDSGTTGSLGAPSEIRSDVVLKDGSTLRVRPVASSDEEEILAFLENLTPETRSLRFGGALSEEMLKRRAGELAGWNERGPNSLALVATTGDDDRIIGHAGYAGGEEEDRAEVAFLVADAWQGRGLGSTLLGQLARLASERGVDVFEASVQPRNHQMLGVFRESGFAVRIDVEPDEVTVAFPTAMTEEAREAFERRDWTAAVSAAAACLRPKSVAVIGASRQRGTIAGEVFRNLLEFGFQGPVYPINPNAEVVQSVRAYPDIASVPGDVELAVIVVPASAVLRVAEACGRKGVRALVVISAGFAEVGETGRKRQDELMEICSRTGMRLIGPNCMGVFNTSADVRLNATFAPIPPAPGHVAFMSQSGALGLAVMDYADVLGLGLSSFVSVGNKADLSGNDFIRYWAENPETEIVLLYLESFGNPRKFSGIARRVAREKPIVAVKSGRSPAGQRASGSHTGALLAASDVTVDALFRQTGVIRTDTLGQMFDVAALLANQPPPDGRRVAILTNSGGPGILCADACAAEGLEVPVLAESTQSALRELLSEEASVGNPVDMIASASAEQYREAIRVIGDDPNVDALIVIFIPPLVTRPEDAARAVVDGVRSLNGEKTVLSVFMQARGVPNELRSGDLRIPSYTFPEDAAIALGRAARYGEWKRRPHVAPPAFEDARREEAAGVVADALGRNADWLAPNEVASLLDCYGLPVLEQRVVASPDAAAAAALQFGEPVALKAIAPGLVHKTDAGAVRLDVDPADVRAAAEAMDERLRDVGHEPSGYLVQRMADEGVEMIVGVVHDRQFGPVVACGAGGVLVELIKDVSVRLTPLNRQDATEMIEGLRTRELLSGYRGSPPRDEEALIDIVLRTAALVDDLPQVRELDLNPILVHETGATIVDARVRVGRPDRRPLPGSR